MPKVGLMVCWAYPSPQPVVNHCGTESVITYPLYHCIPLILEESMSRSLPIYIYIYIYTYYIYPTDHWLYPFIRLYIHRRIIPVLRNPGDRTSCGMNSPSLSGMILEVSVFL